MTQVRCGSCGHGLQGFRGRGVKVLLCPNCGWKMVFKAGESLPGSAPAPAVAPPDDRPETPGRVPNVPPAVAAPPAAAAFRPAERPRPPERREPPAPAAAAADAEPVGERADDATIPHAVRRRNMALIAFGIVGSMAGLLATVLVVAASGRDKPQPQPARTETVVAGGGTVRFTPPDTVPASAPERGSASAAPTFEQKSRAAPADGRPRRPALPGVEPDDVERRPALPRGTDRHEVEDGATPTGSPPRDSADVTAPNPDDDGGAASAGEAPLDKDAAVARVKRATAFLRVQFADGTRVTGSGFLTYRPGLVITNAHVLGMLDPSARKPRSVQVVFNSGEADSRTFNGTVLGVDRGADLGAVQVDPTGLPPPLRVIRADHLVETQDLLAYGFPRASQVGLNITVAKTSVSSLRKLNGVLEQIQFNGGIEHGSSGGPITDAAGRVVGVAVAGIPGTLLNFAIPGERVLYFLNGRAAVLSVNYPYADGGKVKVEAKVEMIDPLGRVRDVAVDVWSADSGMARPAEDAEPAPQAGDSPKHTFALAYNKATAVATGVVELPSLEGPGKLYWTRTVYTDGAGRKHWTAGDGRPLPPPVSRLPIALQRPPAVGEHTTASLTSAAGFMLLAGDGRERSIALELKAGVDERVAEARGPSGKQRVGFTGCTLSILEDGKPRQGAQEVQQYAALARNLAAELDLHGYGGVAQTRVDYRHIPPAAREALQEIGEQLVQSLGLLSVPLPPGMLQPLQTWGAQRQVRVGMLGGVVPCVADVTYTYLGTREREGKLTAVISLTGKVRGAKGAGDDVGGTVDGTAYVHCDTGRVAAASASVKVDLDLSMRGHSFKGLGTLTVKVRRGPQGAASDTE